MSTTAVDTRLAEVEALLRELEVKGLVNENNRHEVRRFALAMAGAVPEFHGDNPPLYDCPECGDRGVEDHPAYIPSAPRERYGHSYAGVWFCGCTKGQALELAYWLDVVYPMGRNGKRGHSHEGEKRMQRYFVSGWPFAQKIRQLFPDYATRMGV